jgi:hypothetical protein
MHEADGPGAVARMEERALSCQKKLPRKKSLIVTCAFHAAYSANVRFLIVHGKLTRSVHAEKQ